MKTFKEYLNEGNSKKEFIKKQLKAKKIVLCRVSYENYTDISATVEEIDGDVVYLYTSLDDDIVVPVESISIGDVNEGITSLKTIKRAIEMGKKVKCLVSYGKFKEVPAVIQSIEGSTIYLHTTKADDLVASIGDLIDIMTY